jgi:1,2-phenylacetyl-CoA epoxidase catalytic subunit
VELSLAQLLFDRAGYFQLREYADSCWEPHRKLVGPILAEEAEHQQDGADVVLATVVDGPAMQAVFDLWLRISLLSFGRPGSQASNDAIALGLKRNDPADVMRQYLDDVRPIADRAGLHVPSPRALGIEG